MVEGGVAGSVDGKRDVCVRKSRRKASRHGYEKENNLLGSDATSKGFLNKRLFSQVQDLFPPLKKKERKKDSPSLSYAFFLPSLMFLSRSIFSFLFSADDVFATVNDIDVEMKAESSRETEEEVTAAEGRDKVKLAVELSAELMD